MTVSNQPQSEASRFCVELNAQFRLPLVAYFLKRVGNRSEAEDLTQEVFVRVLAQSEIVDPARANSYVFTAAANLLRDRHRQAAARRTSSFGSLDEPLRATSYQLIEDINPERVVIGRQTLRDVLSALDGLSRRTRDIFVLYRVEKMKQHEIAVLYGLSDSCVEKHVAKAIVYMSQRFQTP